MTFRKFFKYALITFLAFYGALGLAYLHPPTRYALWPTTDPNYVADAAYADEAPSLPYSATEREYPNGALLVEIEMCKQAITLANHDLMACSSPAIKLAGSPLDGCADYSVALIGHINAMARGDLPDAAVLDAPHDACVHSIHGAGGRPVRNPRNTFPLK